ncbi:hypothetical protein EGW08_005548 [Elysia chlorotica]|uniref:Uncharacterized protein n=1 Tax=Elysia chlorotica TaxID=188477 RepID=A0A433TYL6_ELYCH|nr:hypothetical protein EGW08_005548 [Elysia chlorotica]
MGTKVIDKLRIQGKSAPRVILDSSPSRRPLGMLGQAVEGSPASFVSPTFHGEPAASRGASRGRASRPTLVLIPEPGQDVPVPVNSKVGRSLASSIPSSSSSSAASRRLEFLQRVQQANRGLSTADLDTQHTKDSALAYTRQQISDSISNVARVNCAYTHQGNTILPNIQFLLRGKPVQQEDQEIGHSKVSSAPSMNTEVNGNNSFKGSKNVQVYVPHQRVGHYKTSAKELYRARHKHDIMQSLLVDPRHASSAYRAIRNVDIDVAPNANTVLGNSANAANGPAYFYLGPPMSAPNQTKPSSGILNRPKLYTPTASTQTPSGEDLFGRHGEGRGPNRGLKYLDNFSLTGQQLTTPRLVNIKTGEEEEHGLGDYADLAGRQVPCLVPDMSSRPGGSPPLISGSRSRKHGGGVSTRCMSRESSGAPPVPPCSSAAGADLELLQRCLKVNQPLAENGAGAGTSSSDSVRLKHCTQYVKKDDSNASLCNSNITNTTGKVNYNNPYRNNHRIGGGEKQALLSQSKSNRYVFNSVNSYIHFNKIYPRIDGNANDPSSAANNNGTIRPRIPQVDGFSPHCTETVMLKMMFGMNKPAPSVKSGARYSDIAVHADLDEFVVIGSTTTSLSRSTSVASRKIYNGSVYTGENVSDSSNTKRLSNSTLRRSKSNMSFNNDISIDLRERKVEEDGEENNMDEDPTWPIQEVEDEIAKTAVKANLAAEDENSNNVGFTDLEESERTLQEEVVDS